MTTVRTDALVEDGRTYLVDTRQSEYVIDTKAKTITRTNILGDNPREHDGVALEYEHIAVDVECPIVVKYRDRDWRYSTPVLSIEAV